MTLSECNRKFTDGVNCSHLLTVLHLYTMLPPDLSLALTVFSPLFCSLVLILLSSSHSTDFCSLCSLQLTVLSAHLCSLCSHLLTAFCLLLFLLSNAH